MRIKLFSIFLSVATCSIAQWSQNPAVDNAICVQPYEQINVKHVSDLKGGAILVWEDYRNDPTGTIGDIYAQRISAAGNVMWTLNGVAICTDAADQASPNIVTDSAGGAFIVWQDRRGTKRNLYAQRIDSSGNALWTANGIGVTLRNYDQKNAKLICAPNNELLVLWQDSVGNDYDIYAQRLNSTGSPQWTGGVGVATGFGSQVNVKAQLDGSGNIFVTWQDKRNGSDYDIYVQKLNMSGVSQWTANGVNICNLAGTQNGPKIVLDNTGGAIVVWQDKRNGIDYDLYSQRVNASGTAQWTANGKAIVVAVGSQSSIDVTSKNISNGVVFGWKDARNGTNNVDVYGQMFDLSGTALWGANGKPIANATANQLNVNVSNDGFGGTIFVYQDSSGGTWDIKAQRVNASGTLLWGTGVGIGTAAGDQLNENVTLADNGSSIYSFQDFRNATDNDIYAFKIDMNGAPVFVKPITASEITCTAFPNPSNGNVTVWVSGKDFTDGFVLTVFDDLGRVVISQNVRDNKYVIAGKLAAGVYTYKVQSANGAHSGKFVMAN